MVDQNGAAFSPVTRKWPIEMIDTRVYAGPNVYLPNPAIRCRVKVASTLSGLTSDETREVTDRLTARIQNDVQHESMSLTSQWTQGGERTWPSYLAHLALILQNVVTGSALRLCYVAPNDSDASFDVCFDYEHSVIGVAAAILAVATLNDVVGATVPRLFDRDEEFDQTAAFSAFSTLAQEESLDRNTLCLLRAARLRNIPVILLSSDRLQLGYGAGRIMAIRANLGLESHDARATAKDKVKTCQILRADGIPVPEQIRVGSETAAVAAAARLGYPVVVKPATGRGSAGVFLDLRNEADVRAAVANALLLSSDLVVETYYPGNPYRLSVVDGEFIASYQRIRPQVFGDGTKTIRELIDDFNSDPRRRNGRSTLMNPVEIDDSVLSHLADQGVNLDFVPSIGQLVTLSSFTFIGVGGSLIDVTDDVHPDNRDLAIRAAGLIKLRVGGVDMVTQDISGSWREVGGVICEVNAYPGLNAHAEANPENANAFSVALVDRLFPRREVCRIPIAAITGTNGKTTTTRMVVHIAKLCGYMVGSATTHGAYIGKHRLLEGDVASYDGAVAVLRNPYVEMAILETARGGILSSGLGFDRCSVAAVLNVDEDHLGSHDIESLDQMAQVKCVVARSANDTVVLNADDHRCVGMTGSCCVKHVCYVTMAPDNAMVATHIRKGGRAVRLEISEGIEEVVLHDSGQRKIALSVGDLPSTLNGVVRHNLQNAMFAAGIAYGLGCPTEVIIRGLRDFDCSYEVSPGRMNYFDRLPFKVLMDRAHNKGGLRAVHEATRNIAVAGRRICLLQIGGNRRDRQVIDIGRSISGWFDEFVLTNRDDLRGREPEEIPALLRIGLLEEGVAEKRITRLMSEEEAVDHALRMARPEDFLHLFAYDCPRTWSQVHAFAEELAGASASATSEAVELNVRSAQAH